MTSDHFLLQLPNPQTYTGKEINVVLSPPTPDDIRICLVFPDIYEIGMSHGGFKLLYHFLNDLPGVSAERAFLPEPRGVEVFRSQNISLFSLESKTPLRQFDLVGITLMSELNFTNLLLFLDLAGIPLLASDRGQDFPLIVAGGITTVNPEPLRDFIDFFAVGDGEAMLPAIVDTMRKHKQRHGREKRKDLLAALEPIAGIYVPALHSLEKRGPFFSPARIDKKIHKQVFSGFSSFPYSEQEIVPITNAVFNRLNVEIARGCPQRCRFCQARAYYAPYRFKGLDDILRFLSHALSRTGYESFSLSSLSSGDFPHLSGILSAIPNMIGPDISFSVPSLRPSALCGNLLETIALFRRTGITLVPEAGSQRLRKVLNKNVDDSEIFHALALAKKHGWQRIKLYFMIGLPGERQTDIDAMISLIRRMHEFCREGKKRIRFHVSFSSFVPKPHTPLQWVKMESVANIMERIWSIRFALKSYKSIQLDFHSPEKAAVETLLARGDQRMGQVILQAYRRGETFTAWEDHFHFPVWKDLIDRAGLDFLLDEFSPETQFPWDFLEIHDSEETLRREYQSARAAMEAPDIHTVEAAKSEPAFASLPEIPSHRFSKKKVPPVENFEKMRFFYEKKGDFRFFSHLSLAQYLERLLRMSGLHFKCTEGFHPRVRISFLPPLPVGAQGEDEVLEIYVEKGHSLDEILESVNRQSSLWQFKRIEACTQRPSMGKDIRFFLYCLAWAPDPSLHPSIHSLLGPLDEISIGVDQVSFRIHSSANGQERFSRIYRHLDPDRKNVLGLIRRGVEFASEH